MHSRSRPSIPRQHQHLASGILLWLFGGSALLLTRLVPAYVAVLGWSPMFWLLLAPLIMLLVLEPGLPRQALARSIPSRRAGRARNWS